VIYLASPYTHPDKAVEQQRYEAVSAVCAKLARKGDHVYSPIAHWHPIALAHNMPTDHVYYKLANEAMIQLCSDMLVLRLPGWRESKGVQAEIDYARSIGCWVAYIDE
jgi:hypothetical protein